MQAVSFGDRLPGMGVAVRRAEVEVTPGAAPLPIPNLWMAAVGPRYFETFNIPLIAGRDFHDGDRTADARTVLVNEAFVRQYMNGASPVGRRVRYAHPATALPWLEIVGVVRDIGMTPTDNGEAPYVFRATSPATASPLVLAVRTTATPRCCGRESAPSPSVSTRTPSGRPCGRSTIWCGDEDPPHARHAGGVATRRRPRTVSVRSRHLLADVGERRAADARDRPAPALGASQTRLLAGIFVRARC